MRHRRPPSPLLVGAVIFTTENSMNQAILPSPLPPILAVSLVTLVGDGDTYRFLVPVGVIAWARMLRPGHYHVDQERLQALGEFFDHESDAYAELVEEDFDFEVTPGSGFNDVLLTLNVLVRRFDSEKEALAYAEAQGWIVAEEINGAIY